MEMRKITAPPAAVPRINRHGVYGQHQFLARVFDGGHHVFVASNTAIGEFYVYCNDGQPMPGIMAGTTVETRGVPAFHVGSRWRFVVAVNAVVDAGFDDDGVDGGYKIKRIGITAARMRKTGEAADVARWNAAHDWMRRQGARLGFELGGDLHKAQERRVYVEKKRDVLKFDVLDIDGTLQVTDAEKFSDMLLSGIGKARRFGFGMVLLGRLK